MDEQEIIDSFDKAIQGNHLFACYQPQVNHTTGRMVGAEALMRWKNPEYGMQYPTTFIPVLEKNNLIYRADIHLFEAVCKFQKKCIDAKLPVVPISVNMSRYDIVGHDYVGDIEKIRKAYDVPVKYLRIEITESSAIAGIQRMQEVIAGLHSFGYIVEMDDFGSGYSSLNILKDLDVDIIKLDMQFLQGEVGGRGGIILNTIVQMAKWLGTPLIVEGVETMEQADYMKSIGCSYIQGYLYSKPLLEDAFQEKICKIEHEPLTPALKLIDTINAGAFWNPESMETLIFNNLVGAAALFTYTDDTLEVLRINKKYLREICMNHTEQEVITADPWRGFDETNRKIYEDAIRKAIASGEEESCETWRTIHSQCCGDDNICIRSTLRVIGTAENQYLVYAMVQNITAEKRAYMVMAESEQKFRFASEQANVYAWEYIISTRQMRPCYRCMRDLNLPPVVENYPEPAIEMGIFPPEVADDYREMMRKVDSGIPQIEAVFPLTACRVPFHVRYTTEFDENGRPLKAFGSATLVVDPSQKEAAGDTIK
ncbi:MAG: EAL domain-containing protein [Desulfovibrio sp.]|nr:EAL domain-containing protein [Desulfovibrio sp.]